ncbi:MAG: TIGR03619 family F420-dependent LLM class oxidoreductase [Acidimicrobiales bacterium]
MKVRIGFGLGTQSGSDETDGFKVMVDALETCGFDSLWMSERVGGTSLDPMVALAVAAGRTTRLKLGTSVLVLPGRSPALMAKQLASLDVLSDGRFLPAVGLGVANSFEQQAFGVERNQRASFFDEALPLMRRFWTGHPVDHHGPRFTYDGLVVRPRPRQDPLEVWMGGRAPAELKRVGRMSDGWLASFCTPESAQEGVAIVAESAAEHGRTVDPEHFGAILAYGDGTALPNALAERIAAIHPDVDPARIVAPSLQALGRLIEKFIAVGVSKFVLTPVAPSGGWKEEITRLAHSVLPLQGTRN